jgi:hypothetical protein
VGCNRMNNKQKTNKCTFLHFIRALSFSGCDNHPVKLNARINAKKNK